MARTQPGERRWLRAAGLLVVTLTVSVQPLVLIALPFAAMSLLTRGRALLVATVLAALVLVGAPGDGSWYLERGWALLIGGWFAALTLRWPASGFLPRALGAVAGSFATGALFFLARPDAWPVADWILDSRIQGGVATALEGIRVLQGEAGLSPAVVAAVVRAAEIQGLIHPALLGLGSLSALGVAWWLSLRLGQGSDRALGPLRDFRFNDQLVWILILGIVAVVVRAGDGWARLGTNAMVFMGALYALRGAAVVVFLSGGVSILGALMAVLGLLFLAPVILSGALIIGLGDTWLDLRGRARTIGL